MRKDVPEALYNNILVGYLSMGLLLAEAIPTPQWELTPLP
jgi:hypothetical protein